MNIFGITGQYLELLQMAEDETLDQHMINDTWILPRVRTFASAHVSVRIVEMSYLSEMNDESLELG